MSANVRFAGNFGPLCCLRQARVRPGFAKSLPGHVALRHARPANEVAKPEGLNLLQSNGRGAAEAVMHFSIPALPRRLGGELKSNWPLVPGKCQAIAALAEKIGARMR